MRAKTGRVAVVMLSSIGICGCTSSPSWNHFSLWRKKPDTTAVADAPKFNPGNPTLPSANQNPGSSLASTMHPSAALAAAATTTPAAAPGMTGYGAMPAAYQNSPYPTTPYQQARLPAAAGMPAPGPSAANPAAAMPGANGLAGGTSWNGGTQIPGPTVGYGAGSTMPGRYAPGNVAAPMNGVMPQNQMASAPAYGSAAAAATAPGAAAATTTSAQPQAGFYNPTYDGGGAATRYASGATIPSQVSAPSMTAGAPQYNPASATMPNSSTPDYRTADARNGAPATTGVEAGAGGTMGDRYAGFNGAASGAGATTVTAAPASDRYAVPGATPSAAAGGMSGVGNRYSQPAGGAAGTTDQGSTGYQPGAMANPVGATGYHPVDNAYTVPTSSSAMSAPPTRSNTEYRPGGTSNYISPTGNIVQPGGTGVQSESRSSGGVAPASYTPAASNSQKGAGVVLAAAISPTNSGEAYGAYQGGTAGTAPTGLSSFNTSTSEPAYGAPNPVAATPALLPAAR